MFRRKNLRWTLPALVVALVAGGVAMLILGGRSASALSGPVQDTVSVAQAVSASVPGATESSAPAGLTVEGLVAQMQGRADAVGGLEGVIGVQMTLPVEGAWKGMPFKYKSPDSFIELTGTRLASPGGEPVSEENAWRLFRGGEMYARSDGETMKLQPGKDYKGLSIGDDPEALLLANLMPSAWFGAFTKDLKLQPDEEVDGVAYHVIVERQIFPRRGQTMLRWTLMDSLMQARQPRRPRKYYVNATTLLCDRVVLARQILAGEKWVKDPFVGATMDIVASEVKTVGGGQLPTTYTKRYYGDSGVYQSQTLTLSNVSAKGASGLAAADFDPLTLTPGEKPVILRPQERMEDLEKLAETDRDDPGLMLTLANGYTWEGALKPAQEALAKADAAAGGGDFPAVRGHVWTLLEPKVVTHELKEAPQLERIYTERAARFRSLGDEKHAAFMDAKATAQVERKSQALTRAQALNLKIKGVTEGSK